MNNETKCCPFCGEEILAVAKKCKHCGEYLDENLREKNVIKGNDFVPEKEVLKLDLTDGNIILTNKKIRGRTLVYTRDLDGRKISRIEDLDIWVHLITSTTIETIGASNAVLKGFICFLLLSTLYIWLMSSAQLLTGGPLFIAIVLVIITLIFFFMLFSKNYFLLISISGNNQYISFGKKRDVAFDFLKKLKEVRAEYDKIAGL